MSEPSKRTDRLELILQVFADLDDCYTNEASLEAYINLAHQLLSKLMYAKNFYLALYHRDSNSIQFVYNVDDIDQEIDPKRKFPLSSSKQSRTSWIIVNKKKLILTAAEDKAKEQQIKQSNVNDKWGRGERAQHWMGMPLLSHKGHSLGALVIQSYIESKLYSKQDQKLFALFSTLVANAIGKHKKLKSLESNIFERTLTLENKLSEKRHDEKLQQALFEISTLTNQEIPLKTLYQNIHEIVDKLLYARNFYILIFDEDTNEITFPYFVDEKDGNDMTDVVLPLGEGMSSYVIQTRKPQLLTPAITKTLVKEGAFKEVLGSESISWIGAPMISSNALHGVIVVQSYDKKILFSEQDLTLLNYVANHVATAIEVTINTQQRRASQINLAKNHRLLEQQNDELKQTLAVLKKTQQELIQKEKMASLGGLVAGIAHEINTPLGICVTGVSHLIEEAKIFRQGAEKDSLTEAQLWNFLNDVDEIGKILTTNTKRAADLIQSFKQIAVDQSSNEIRQIRLKHYLEEVVLSLRPMLKRTKHLISIHCDEALEMNTNAGALSQIISNLVLNSVKHGFDNIEQGAIDIRIVEKKGIIVFQYKDNGKGLNEKDMQRLFDPFFTTKRGEGGSGLGTHLIFNLVTSSLQGKLTAKSQIGKGLSYTINFPKDISKKLKN